MRVKSPSPYRSPAVRTAAFGTVWIQPSPAVRSASSSSASDQPSPDSCRAIVPRTVRASRLLAGTRSRPASRTDRTSGAVKAAAIIAAAHIAPYTPFPVCDRTASRRASDAARRGSPGHVQP
ncbi:hypothetical protein SNARM312S_05724 [Streptomyces narbonensis]